MLDKLAPADLYKVLELGLLLSLYVKPCSLRCWCM